MDWSVNLTYRFFSENLKILMESIEPSIINDATQQIPFNFIVFLFRSPVLIKKLMILQKLYKMVAQQIMINLDVFHL